MAPWILALTLAGPPGDVPVQRPTKTPEPAPAAEDPAPAPAPSPEPEPLPVPVPVPVPEPEPEPEPAPAPVPAPPPASAPPPPDPAPAPSQPEPPRRRGTGLLIAAGGVATGAIVGRTLFGLVLLDSINQTQPERAPRIYAIGALVSIPAGAAITLGALSRTFAAKRDLHRDIYERRIGPRPKTAHVIAGWTLLGVGVAGWLGTRVAAQAVANRCPRGECFVIYMESSWHASVALSTTGAMLGSYGTHYTRLAKRSHLDRQLVVTPLWNTRLRGLALSGTF